MGVRWRSERERVLLRVAARPVRPGPVPGRPRPAENRAHQPEHEQPGRVQRPVTARRFGAAISTGPHAAESSFNTVPLRFRVFTGRTYPASRKRGKGFSGPDREPRGRGTEPAVGRVGRRSVGGVG